MEELEQRVRSLETRTDNIERSLTGDDHEPGMFERLRTIERRRLLTWLLLGNIAAVVGSALVNVLMRYFGGS